MPTVLNVALKMVGTLRFAHPTAPDYDAAIFLGTAARVITNPS